MTETLEKLPILFRAERTKDADVTAVLPTLPWGYDGTFTVYAHVGQHGAGGFDWYNRTRRARPEEYASLLAELQGIYGRKLDPQDEAYELVVYQRMQPQWRMGLRRG